MLEFRRVLLDRKSTRLNSSHTLISYAVFCLKKKNKEEESTAARGITEMRRGNGQVRDAVLPPLSPPSTTTSPPAIPTTQPAIFFFFFNAAAPTDLSSLSPHAAFS